MSSLEILGFEISYIYGILTVLAAIYYYRYHKKHQFWEKQGISSPSRLPIIGNVLDNILAEDASLTEINNVKKFGRIYGGYAFMKPGLHIADADVIKQLMVKDFHYFSQRFPIDIAGNDPRTKLFLSNVNGHEWKRQRTIMSPTFTSAKMRRMFHLMSTCVDSVESVLEKKSKTGDDIDAKHLFGCYSLDVIAKCCFALDTSAHDDPDNSFVKHAETFFGFSAIRIIKFLLVPKMFKNYFTMTLNPKEDIEFFSALTSEMIKRRKQDPKNKMDDFLQLMIEAKSPSKFHRAEEDDKLDSESHHVIHDETVISNLKDTSFEDNQEDHQLTDLDIIANSMLFIAAGYETTSRLLASASYALATNADVQETLHQSIKAAVEANEGTLDYNIVSQNQFLDAVISETLRMYTPVLRLPRVAVDDYVLEWNGLKLNLPKETALNICHHAIHHDPEYWPKPETFDPTRFLPENRHKIYPYSYIPFGSGPRNCIGMRFALLEAKLVLARIVLKYRLIRSPKTEEKLDLTKSFVTLHAKSVTIAVEKR